MKAGLFIIVWQVKIVMNTALLVGLNYHQFVNISHRHETYVIQKVNRLV